MPEFLIDQPLRRLEVGLLCQGVEQIALQPDAGHGVVFPLIALGHDPPQLGQVVECQLLRKFVVHGWHDGTRQLLGGDVEGGGLPGEVLVAVLLREGDRDRPVLARAHPFQLVGEPRNEPGAAKLDVDVVACPVGERDAVDLADEIDRQHFAGGGAGMLAPRLQLLRGDLHQFPVAGGHFRQRLIHQLRRHLGLAADQADLAEIRQGDIRQQLEFDLEFQVLGGAGAGNIGGDQVDLWRLRRAHVALGDHLFGRLVDRFLQHLGSDGIAVALANDGQRHLAGPEAGQAQRLAEIGEPRGAAGFDVLARHHNREAALQALGQRFGNLHRPDNPPKVKRRRRSHAAGNGGAGGGT